jgi:hypothetical protein
MNAATASHQQTRPVGAKQPVTWGDLFLILEKRPQDLQRAILEKIMELDAA